MRATPGGTAGGRLALLLWAPPVAAVPASAQQAGAAADVAEEIYVARSLRESREEPSTFCAPARTGFGAAGVEDRYSFWSVAVGRDGRDGRDGRVRDAGVEQVGDLRACFGGLPGGGGSFFYAEGSLGGVTFTGRGDCRGSSEASPEPGVGVTRCYMDLTELPAPYVGGRLTTNTINSGRTLGDVSDPPGYTQASIATVRLWRSR